MKKQQISIKQGVSTEKNEKSAVHDLYSQIHQDDDETIIFFCSSKYDLKVLGAELHTVFSGQLIGCTTAGEISKSGFTNHSITGVSIQSDELFIVNQMITDLDKFGANQAKILNQQLKKKKDECPSISQETTIGLLLIDGLSIQEEKVAALLYHQFENMNIFGGSAGDDLNFKETFIYHNGNFISNAASFSLIVTSLPIKTFKTQHFDPTDIRLVITDAIPEKRIVNEINALPAADEYARITGVETHELNTNHFSLYPLMLNIGGDWYVRSIQKVNDDGSLTFYCAIDRGLVLTIGKGKNYISHLEQELQNIQNSVPNPQLIIGCNCIQRQLEAQEKDLVKYINSLLKDMNFVGFHTYGEQFSGAHINQTLTGVVIGAHE